MIINYLLYNFVRKKINTKLILLLSKDTVYRLNVTRLKVSNIFGIDGVVLKCYPVIYIYKTNPEKRGGVSCFS